ncbi:hypothetical protein FRB95_003432 [Tulasnella sp. JGI-2019a]|nr:hypothetical protein FRB95_003432 [Tulasnella sp. JGI-2019a]
MTRMAGEVIFEQQCWLIAPLPFRRSVEKDRDESYTHIHGTSQLEKHVSALTNILDSLELNPSSYEALCTHARIRMDQGYYEEAITIYTNAQNMWLCGEQNPADGQAIAQELGWAEDALGMSQCKDYYGILG